METIDEDVKDADEYVHEHSVDYTQRANWSMKEVELYCPDRQVVVA